MQDIFKDEKVTVVYVGSVVMKKQSPQKIHVIKFPPGELEPLFIKAPDIGKVIIGLSPKTAANWRSLGIGPRYHILGASVYYEYKILKDFFSGGLVQTTGNLVQQREVDPCMTSKA